MRQKNKKLHINLKKFYTEDKFGLLIDLPTMVDHFLQGTSMHLVNTRDGVHLEFYRKGGGSGQVKCHVFVISDSQMTIQERKLSY